MQALRGGYLKHGHFEMMRFAINRFLGTKNNIFAEWRVEAPHKAMTKRSPGTRLGGGKGKSCTKTKKVWGRHVVLMTYIAKERIMLLSD